MSVCSQTLPIDPRLRDRIDHLLFRPAQQLRDHRRRGDLDQNDVIGDLAIMRSDGHVSLTGRVKDIIIRKGENIAAREIEDVLYAHPKVAAVAVIGLPDVDRGERVCAVVETAEGADDLTQAEMVAACAEAELMVQKVPEQLVVHDGPMPRNATLKVLKYELKEALAEVPWP